MYVYRNRFWNHPRVSDHIYFHYMPDHVVPEGKHARVFIYQNTFATMGQFTVQFQPDGGLLSVVITYPDGSSSVTFGIEFPGVIFWIDIALIRFF